ncbi:MAG: copper amine oxidase N-terminal domain-containing protein [Peptococcaceae bacterium]|jgi:hypothetical protein|nr:copper amine oxidase N-terminal domain-containing protein [Peptococcaceae bacterium]
MFHNRSGLFRILLSSLAAASLLLVILSGAGTALAGTSGSTTVVTMGNEQLSFPGPTATASIVTSGGGYDLINPGFNFSSGQETSGWSGNPDLSFGTDANGQPALSGNVTILPQSGDLSAAPTQATVTVAVGDQLVVLTGGGSYYLVNITAASPESVAFNYQAGTVQPIAQPSTQPTVTPEPTVTQEPTPQTPSGSQTITVSVGGQQEIFQSEAASGTITTAGGGFSFQSGQETSGSAGDISVSTDSSGELILSGDFAVMKQGQDGSYSSDVPSQQVATISSADNSTDLIFQSASGHYVLVQLSTVSGDSVQFTYIIGPQAPSSQPATAPAPGSSPIPSAGPQLLNLTDQPVVLHGRTFVPMRELFEALGATVEWDGEYQVVTATKGSTTIKLQIGNTNAYINGNQQQLDDAPFIQNGRTYVPLRFAAEALGENVSYDPSTTKVTFGNYYFYINPATAPGQGTNNPPEGNQPSPTPTPTPTPTPNPTPSPATTPSGTFTADGDHYTGNGLDVTADASLADGGVNGTIEVTVTVNAPAGVSNVSVGQSYEEYGQTITANLSEISQSGNTWTFALFADQLNKNQPFQVQISSGQTAGATIIFNWPANLLQYMAS